MNGNIQKGELITYNLTELIKPEAYEVRLTPITRFGEGDSTIRVIKYSGKKSFVYERRVALYEHQSCRSCYEG